MFNILPSVSAIVRRIIFLKRNRQQEIASGAKVFPEFWTSKFQIGKDTLQIVSNGTEEGTTYICDRPGYANIVRYAISTGVENEIGHDGDLVKASYSPLGIYVAISSVYHEPHILDLSEEVKAAFDEYHAGKRRLMKKYPGIVF